MILEMIYSFRGLRNGLLVKNKPKFAQLWTKTKHNSDICLN